MGPILLKIESLLWIRLWGWLHLRSAFASILISLQSLSLNGSSLDGLMFLQTNYWKYLAVMANAMIEYLIVLKLLLQEFMLSDKDKENGKC